MSRFHHSKQMRMKPAKNGFFAQLLINLNEFTLFFQPLNPQQSFLPHFFALIWRIEMELRWFLWGKEKKDYLKFCTQTKWERSSIVIESRIIENSISNQILIGRYIFIKETVCFFHPFLSFNKNSLISVLHNWQIVIYKSNKSSLRHCSKSI